jgi:hypothetical protein
VFVLIDPRLIRKPPLMDRRSSAIARTAIGFLVVVAALVGAGGGSAGAATLRLHSTPVRQALIPVMAQVTGAYPGGLLRSATVRVYDLAPPPAAASRAGSECSARHGGPLLVGTGRTGTRGVTVVRLCERAAPRQLRVVVSGGRTASRKFSGTMMVQLRHAAHHAVYVNPPSTLVARYLIAHPRRGLTPSQRRVRRFLGLPSFFDFAGDMAARNLFDGARFWATARKHGSFDRYVKRLVRRLGAANPAPIASAALTAATASSAGGQCWQQAAQSTAGFATFLGFRGVPSEGLAAPPLCSGSAGSDALQSTRAQDAGDGGARGPYAHAAGVVTDVFGALLGVAGLSYSIFSGNSSSKQLSSIESSLSTMQSEMVAIQNTLAQLQTQIANVNTNVLNGNVSALAADAAPTVNAIKADGEDINALVGALYQVVCPSTGCATTRLPPPANVAAAFNAICYPDNELNRALAAQCNNVSQAEYNALLDIKGQKPAQAVSNLAEWSLGSAGVTLGAKTGGIVQYELEAGAPTDGFFETQDAASARLEWGYYTLASVWAQTTFAEAAGMGIGQPEPGTGLKHPPLLTPSAAKSGVNAMNPTIDAFMGAFPNMPDTAVINTNNSAADGDPPAMWAQRVGGLSTWDAFSSFANYPWDLNDGGGIGSTDGGMASNPLSNSAQAPIVMTPAASSGQTWVMLPASGIGAVPSMSSARFSDWLLGQGGVSSSNNQVLNGPLGDLYDQAPGFTTSATQTRGQWMTTNSGINPQLLTITGMGYSPATIGSSPNYNTYAGMFFYYNCNQTNCNTNQSEWAADCPPAGDTSCLLPTYYNIGGGTDPFNAYASSTGNATGLFDYNQGLLITNQQGHATGAGTSYPNGGTFNTDTSQWVNEWGNFPGTWCYKSNECYPGVMPLIDTGAGASSQKAAFGSNGRPILFDRTQVAAGGSTPNSDCFFWNGGTSSPADGTGCLVKRTSSGQILPALPSGY